MTSSSDPAFERALDAMVIVYSLLDGHPASPACEQFIRSRTGWFTTVVTLMEVKAVLTKVYGVDSSLASEKLAQFARGPLVVAALDASTTLAAMNTSDTLGIDLTDAVLLEATRSLGAPRLTTDDGRLARACRQAGIEPENPIDGALRPRIAEWEQANLPAKGLPRVLRRVHEWLGQTAPQAAQDFWSLTGGGSHLP
jgi:predicted nucleic acid-binding protein